MNTDFRVSISFKRHPKTRELRSHFDAIHPFLGEHAVLCLLDLWRFAAEFCPSGQFSGRLRATDLEAEVGWRGEPGALLATLVRVGFAHRAGGGAGGERYSLHDWLEHNAYAAAHPERSEKARRAAKIRHARSRTRADATSMLRAETADAPVPVPDPTPDPVPDREHDEHARAAPPTTTRSSPEQTNSNGDDPDAGATEDERATAQGYAAGYRGDSIQANPKPRGPLMRAWSIGYHRGRDEAARQARALAAPKPRPTTPDQDARAVDVSEGLAMLRRAGVNLTAPPEEEGEPPGPGDDDLPEELRR